MPRSGASSKRPAREHDEARPGGTQADGKAKFGIDAMLPGMKFATVAACPVFGGRLKSVDDSNAMAIKGVRQVVRIDNAVAVVGDHMWAAMQGLQALDIEWDEGPNVNVTTASIVAQMARASENDGVVARADGDFAKAIAAGASCAITTQRVPEGRAARGGLCHGAGLDA